LQAIRCGWFRPARDTAAAHWQVKPGEIKINQKRTQIKFKVKEKAD